MFMPGRESKHKSNVNAVLGGGVGFAIAGDLSDDNDVDYREILRQGPPPPPPSGDAGSIGGASAAAASPRRGSVASTSSSTSSTSQSGSSSSSNSSKLAPNAIQQAQAARAARAAGETPRAAASSSSSTTSSSVVGVMSIYELEREMQVIDRTSSRSAVPYYDRTVGGSSSHPVAAAAASSSTTTRDSKNPVSLQTAFDKAITSGAAKDWEQCAGLVLHSRHLPPNDIKAVCTTNMLDTLKKQDAIQQKVEAFNVCAAYVAINIGRERLQDAETFLRRLDGSANREYAAFHQAGRRQLVAVLNQASYSASPSQLSSAAHAQMDRGVANAGLAAAASTSTTTTTTTSTVANAANDVAATVASSVVAQPLRNT
jgi:hypothetical protein